MIHPRIGGSLTPNQPTDLITECTYYLTFLRSFHYFWPITQFFKCLKYKIFPKIIVKL